MSGHSKWAKIKRQKGVNDAKRGNLFTKLAKNITLAAKEGGGDLNMNFTLRLAVDKAKVANMPLNNIQRAIDRATGKSLDSGSFQRVSYEALGPAGVAIIIDCQTDNTNRTVSDIRNIVESLGGKFATTGSLSWQFEEKGLVIVGLEKVFKSDVFGKGEKIEKINVEDAGIELMEINEIEDLSETTWDMDDNTSVEAIELISSKNDFSKVLLKIEELSFRILNAELIKVSKDKVALESDSEKNKLNKLISQLEEHDDVDAVWVNY